MSLGLVVPLARSCSSLRLLKSKRSTSLMEYSSVDPNRKCREAEARYRYLRTVLLVIDSPAYASRILFVHRGVRLSKQRLDSQIQWVEAGVYGIEVVVVAGAGSRFELASHQVDVPTVLPQGQSEKSKNEKGCIRFVNSRKFRHTLLSDSHFES